MVASTVAHLDVWFVLSRWLNANLVATFHLFWVGLCSFHWQIKFAYINCYLYILCKLLYYFGCTVFSNVLIIFKCFVTSIVNVLYGSRRL